MSNLLEQTKTALRLKTDDENIIEEINGLIISGIADLEDTAGIDVGDLSPASVLGCSGRDALIALAVIQFVKLHFGEPDEYDRLLDAYERMKGNLKTAYRKGV